MSKYKFRAWDKGKMYTNLAYITMDGGAMSMRPDRPLITPILMMYTTYNDKEGNEICEGDVISIGSCKAIITFEQGRFGFQVIEGNWIDDWCFCDDNHRMKIIGNIYETEEFCVYS